MTELEQKLLDALKSIACYDTYDTEYDGRMYEICHSCGEHDGAHSGSCEFVHAKTLISDTEAANFIAEGWTAWRGGKNCPVAKGTKLDILHRNGDVLLSKIAGASVCKTWTHANHPLDIVGYRIAKTTGEQQ